MPITPPNASLALTETETDRTALEAAANQQFIDQATVAIEQAISNGQVVAYLTTFENCNLMMLGTYFQNLGYSIILPDYFPLNGGQPAELFGPSYVAYWENQLLYLHGRRLRNPTRIGFSWAIPRPTP